MYRARQLALALAVCAAASTPAAWAVNRCTDAKGRVTYQDAACVGAATGQVNTSEAFSTKPKGSASSSTQPAAGTRSAIADPPANSQYSTYHGAWRGPAQFDITVNGRRDESPHSMSPLVIEIHADGEVAGLATAAGCKISGLATQLVAPSRGELSVTFQGCHDPRLNARYSGNLNAKASAKEATLTLVSLTSVPAAPASVKMRQVMLDAVLKR